MSTVSLDNWAGKMVREAAIWRDESRSRAERRRARSRFAYALSRATGEGGEKLNPLERIGAHMEAVRIADIHLALRGEGE